MGREIEMKIPLSKVEFQQLYSKIYLQKNEDSQNKKPFFSEICVTSSDSREIIKKDEYYSRYNSREERLNAKEPQVIRIRTEVLDEKTTAFFTLKRKNLQNGTEFNREDETFVENPSVLRDFFTEAGYFLWFSKEKKAYSAHCNFKPLDNVDFHMELETVNDLPYVEIEVVDDKIDADIVRKNLVEFVKALGLNPEKRDTRSWVSIISEMKKD